MWSYEERTKGYFTDIGYWGWVPWENDYMLFASESDYLEFVRERHN